MSAKRIREIERFLAVSENGMKTTIVVLQEFIVIDSVTEVKEIPGVKEFITINREKCNQITEDTFKVVRTGMIFTRKP